MNRTRIPLILEELEGRDLLSAGVFPTQPPDASLLAAKQAMLPDKTNDVDAGLKLAALKGGPATSFSPLNSAWYTPAQIQQAYGFNQVAPVNGVPITGAGQTIAIIDVYDDPNILSDANTFSSQFGLPQFDRGTGSPTFTKLNEYGQSVSYPQTNSAWTTEISLDVEWAHAIAPQANIVLIEANSTSTSDVFKAMQTAENYPGVSVVSMSWGYNESNSFMKSNMPTYDSKYLTTPGVTFVAATLDNGSRYGVYWPAISPDVVGVGGTVLTLNASGGYGSETGWGYSTGGISKYEKQPTYQKGIVTQSSTMRTNPDVAYAASNFAVYDTAGGYNGWYQASGTSAGTPQWAALIALADQGREASGQRPLSSTQTLDALYQFAGSYSYFHDITSGSNGAYTAGPGYDLVTGLGTPMANNLIPALIGYVPPASPASSTISPTTVSPQIGSFPLLNGEQLRTVLPSAPQISSSGALLGPLPATEGTTQNGPDNQVSPIDRFWLASVDLLRKDSSWQRDAMTVAGLTARSYFHGWNG
jgi:subtilase family serine protease